MASRKKRAEARLNPLLKARLKAKLSATQLADLSGVTAKTISLYENNRSLARWETLARLADALGIEVESLGYLARYRGGLEEINNEKTPAA